MRTFAQRINVINMSMEKLLTAYDECSKKVNESLYYLFEHGYISTPSVYDEVSVRSVLVNALEDDIKYLCSNLTGEVDLSELRVKYALTVLRNNYYARDLTYLYNYLNAKNNLDDLAEAIRISKRFANEVKPLISISRTNISYRCKINFSNPVIVDCIDLPEGYKLKTIDLRLCTYKKLCLSAKIPTSIIVDAIKSNKALFIKDLTLRKELDFLPLLLSGELVSDTKWGSYLEIAVINYYKQVNSNDKTTSVSGYDFTVLQDSYTSRTTYLNSILVKLGEYEPICLSLDYAYVQVKGVEAKRHVSMPSIIPKHVGAYVIDNFGNELSYINLLRGVTGEFLPSSVVKSYKLKVKGLPTEMRCLKVDEGNLVESKEQYYNISQLSTKDDESIESCIGSNYKIFSYSLDYVLSSLGTNEHDLRLYLYMNIQPKLDVEIPINQYKNMISEFAFIFINAKCGVLEPKLQDMNRSYYTDELVAKASYEAEQYVKQLLAGIN